MNKPKTEFSRYLAAIRSVLIAAVILISICSCSTGGIKSSPESSTSSTEGQPTMEPAELFGTFDEDEAAEMMTLINDFRVQQGLEPYLSDDNLMAWARVRVAEIVILFEHKRLDGSSIATAYPGNSATKFESSLAKGYESSQDVIQHFTEDDTQRSRMLNEEYTHFGVACLTYNGSKYWTMVYLLP
jgi:uncharacterized protein YkwD